MTTEGQIALPDPVVVKLLRKKVRNTIIFGFLYDYGEQLWLTQHKMLDDYPDQGFFIIKVKIRCPKCMVNGPSYAYAIRRGIFCFACDNERMQNGIEGL